MDENEYIRRLRFNRNEYEDILGRMQGASGSAAGPEGRARDRHAYRIADVPMVIEHPEGGTSRFYVYGRNVSRGGISVLHGGFLHTGSACRVLLDREDGDRMSVDGEVRHCRLVAGSCHEIGIRFRSEIDPADLRVPSEDNAPAPSGGFMAISGSILIAESFGPDADLLGHHLSMFGVDVHRAATPDTILDQLEKHQVQLILYGLNLASDEGMGAVTSVRETGFDGPLIALTAETNSEILDRARARGVTAIIAKPYHVDLLIAQLQVHLAEARMPDLLHSTAVDQPGMPVLIVHYVKIVRRMADQIQRAVADAEWPAVREYCCQLKGSGCSYGFQHLTVAAITALNALDVGVVMNGDTSSIDALVKCCRSLESNVSAHQAA